MDPARPIQNRKQDAFERISFAKHLASFLCLEKDDPSIVVGIEGKWGDGKTSCINLVRETLMEGIPQPIIVDFRPWLISTLDSIIEGFFIELASAIGTQSKAKKAKNAAGKVLQFGKILTPIKLIPGVEPWGSLVEKVLSAVGGSLNAAAEFANLSLQARKKDVEKSLKRIDRPIVVIIDDVDRLAPDHVRIVFQMLKSVCDFDRVSYLIAYDPLAVRTALSYDGVYDGEKYLEKIIQVSYPLPRLSFTHLKDYLQRNIEPLTKRYGINLTGIEGELFETMLNKTDLVRVFDTPRDVIRLCNRLRLSAPNTRGEVSFADLVAFEALELKDPELSQIIRTEPGRFLGTLASDEEFASSNSVSAFYKAFAKEEKTGVPPIDELLKRVNYAERKKEAAQSILLFLFPILGGKNFSQEANHEGVNRIRNRDAFLKLLHCGLTSFTYSSEQARRFFQKPEERKQILAEYRDANDLYSWISFLSDAARDSGIEEPLGLCDLLLETMHVLEEAPSSQGLADHIGKFLYEIIKSRRDSTQRSGMLNRLVSSTKSLCVSESTLLHFLSDYGIWIRGKYE